ncbi:MAG: LytR/AlgR family response regulator transcription factor [Ekhidna sp.]
MFPKKNTLLLFVFILIIISFDALQQKYYLETFNLNPSKISFPSLFKNHLIRWVIWIIVSVPFSIIVWKKFMSRKEVLTNLSWTILLLLIIFSTGLSIAFVTIESIFELNTSFEWIEFSHVIIFFTYQKGLAFSFAFFALTLLLFNQSKGKKIEAQTIVIESLEKRSDNLKEALKTSTETEPHLNIKTGYKMKPIPLSEILWIQSDDYCVKVHTKDKYFTLRQSLKTLEQKLSHHHFLRIHRSALLNMQYLDQVNYESSTLSLKNKVELPLSKSGTRLLKEHLRETTV